jgi:methionyl-tRNA formyltransferase
MEKLLLLGMGPTALSALDCLSARFLVVGVMRNVSPGDHDVDEVARLASSLGVSMLTATTPSDVRAAILESQPDCVVCSSYDRLLSSSTLELSKFVNVHYAPLPRYRGRANINWAIINGETETAITIHTMVPGVDAGKILFQQTVPIGPDDTASGLYGTLNEIQGNVLADTVSRHLAGYEGMPQDDSESTYGCTRVPADGDIDWSQSTAQIYALVRALSQPYPGARTYLATRLVTIARATPVPSPRFYAGRIPGRVITVSRTNGFADVLTGDGILRIHELRLPDGQVVPATTVITSTRQTLGLRPVDLLSRIDDLQALLAAAGITDNRR